MGQFKIIDGHKADYQLGDIVIMLDSYRGHGTYAPDMHTGKVATIVKVEKNDHSFRLAFGVHDKDELPPYDLVCYCATFQPVSWGPKRQQRYEYIAA